MKLYFQNHKGEERLIAEVETCDEALDKIKDFCYSRDFNIPYWRSWGDVDKDGLVFDVSSYSEFFILRNN